MSRCVQTSDWYSSQRTSDRRRGCPSAATTVPSSLSLTPVQNKNHDAAQVWDNNCVGRLSSDSPTWGWQKPNYKVLSFVEQDHSQDSYTYAVIY
jgi:hypothetical protein